MFSWRSEMTKRVAWFTGQATNGAVTPHKVYDVFNEDGDSFNLKDDTGDTRFCLKKGCTHICHKDWVFADVVEEDVKVETIVKSKKVKKWSEWRRHTTGNVPKELDKNDIVKVKFSDGTTYKEEAGNWSWFKPKSDGDGSVRFYKVKLKDQEKPKSKWTKNTGVMPVKGNIVVMMKFSDGTVDRTQAQEYSWDFGQTRKIVKWRLAD